MAHLQRHPWLSLFALVLETTATGLLLTGILQLIKDIPYQPGEAFVLGGCIGALDILWRIAKSRYEKVPLVYGDRFWSLLQWPGIVIGASVHLRTYTNLDLLACTILSLVIGTAILMTRRLIFLETTCGKKY